MVLSGEAHGFSRAAAGSWGSSQIAMVTSGTRLALPPEVRSPSELRGPYRDPLELLLATAQCLVFSPSTGCLAWQAYRDLGLPVKVQLVCQGFIYVEAWNSLSSLLSKVSGHLWSSGGESGLFQDYQQGSQASHHVVRGSLVPHWSWCRGIRTYLELRGNSGSSFSLQEHWRGFYSRLKR